MNGRETVIVGVDGSRDAEAALRFAAAEAELRRARLRVVCAWELPSIELWGAFPDDTPGHFRGAAGEIVDEALAIAGQQAPHVARDGAAIEGRPASVLLREAAGASLIVVGSRGRGSLAGVLLGSVSARVVHCAPCPVVVVPHVRAL